MLVILTRLIGKRFNDISRAIDMLCLFLGENYTIKDVHGQQVDVAEFSLHFQTQWRFRKDSTILLASRDICESYCKDISEDWQFNLTDRPDEESSVFDVSVKSLFSKMQGAVVTDCFLSTVNDISIIFSNGVVFEQFMPSSQKDEEWRLIDYKRDEHIVCYDEAGRISEE